MGNVAPDRPSDVTSTWPLPRSARPVGLEDRSWPTRLLLTEEDGFDRHPEREDHREDGFGEIVKQMGLHSVIFGIGDLAWMDIGPVGVNKATMLANLCTRLDINQANTLAIGDFTNDIEMLRWAGVGVAMGSASAAVMAAADTVTSSTPGIGVAEVLDALLA